MLVEIDLHILQALLLTLRIEVRVEYQLPHCEGRFVPRGWTAGYKIAVVGLDVLGVLHGQTPCDKYAPVSTLYHESVVTQDIHHEYFESFGRLDGTEAGFLGCIAGTEPRVTWHDDVESLRVRRGGCGERFDDLTGFEEGARPALEEEEGNGVGGGRGVMGEVEDLWAIVWNIDLDFILIEVLIDHCLRHAESRSATILEEGRWGPRIVTLLLRASHIHPSSNLQGVGRLPLWHPDSNHRP